MTPEELIENFSYLTDWEDKYRYLIDLGEKLPKLPEELHTDEWKVKGCQSQVWLIPHKTEKGEVFFEGDSDAHIVKGLIAVVLTIYNYKSSTEIKQTEIDHIFKTIGLEEHLSPSLRNGLEAMVSKIKYYAEIL